MVNHEGEVKILYLPFTERNLQMEPQLEGKRQEMLYKVRYNGSFLTHSGSLSLPLTDSLPINSCYSGPANDVRFCLLTVRTVDSDEVGL